MKDKELKLALEFLEQLGENHWGNRPDVIATIKEALAQPEPEERNFCPRCGKRRGGDVNYIHTCTPPQPEREWVETNNSACAILRQVHDMLALASFPPKREWVNLTDDEIKEIIGSWGDTPVKGYTRKLMDQIQDKLKEKNG